MLILHRVLLRLVPAQADLCEYVHVYEAHKETMLRNIHETLYLLQDRIGNSTTDLAPFSVACEVEQWFSVC